MRTTIPYVRILAMAGLFLSLSARAHAQPAPAPELDPHTVEVARSALELARKAWGSARSIEGGGMAASGTATAGHVLLTGEAALAGVGLVQATGLIGATLGLTQLYTMRAGSIVQYGNPYGAPAEDIAFPIRRHVREKRPAIPKPFPVPEPLPEDDDEPREKEPGRVYATYTRYHRTTGRYYSGRTSAVIDLAQPWEPQARATVNARHGQRDPGQEPDPTGQEFEDAVLDRYAVGRAVDYRERYRDLAYLAIRGREQQMIDYRGAQRAEARGIEDFHGGAQSDTNPNEPLTENKIRGVARDNPMAEFFHGAANLRFGELAPYTGERRF